MKAKAMMGVNLEIRNTTEFRDFRRFDVSTADQVGAVKPDP